MTDDMTDKELYEKCKEYGALTRRWKNEFVSLLPEVARRKLYRKHGFCSIYEFAAKLAGVGKDTVDEVMRFDEKFKEMPKLKSLIPEVGLSKLRIVANVAKKDTETFWANKVQDMTRGALSMYVKKIRPGTATSQNANLSLFDEQNSVPESQNLKTQNENKSTFLMQLSQESIVKLRLLKRKLEKRENLRSLCKAHHELEHQKRTYSVDEKMLRYLKSNLSPALL